MAIVTIARQLGSQGDELGAKLAERLGYDCIDKERLSSEAETYGLLQPEFAKIGEKRPGFLDRLFRERQLTFIDLVQSMIYDFAGTGNAVFIGLGSHIILRGLPSLLHVAVLAPHEVRCRRIAEREQLSEDAAAEVIALSDRDRSGYMRYLFDVEWLDPVQFDLLLNSGTLDEATCLEILVMSASQPALRAGEEAGREQISKLAIAARVKARLVGSEQVSARYIVARCPEPGVVVLMGRIHSDEERQAALEVAQSVQGVREVRDELNVMILTPTESFYG